jgi:WD40 repeat protein
VLYAGSRPGSAEFYSYSQDGTARVWSLTPPPPPVSTHAGGADLKHAVLDRDATRFVSTTDKNLLRVRETTSGKLLQSLALDPKQSPNNIVARRAGLSPDGTRLFDFRGAWGVTWDVPKGSTVDGLTTPAGTACLDVAPDGKRYAASLALGKGYSLAVVEAAAKDRWVQCGTGQGVAAAFSPDGTLLAAVLVGAQKYDGVVFDSRTGTVRSTFDPTDVFALAFDGKRVATGTRQGKVAVHDAATGRSWRA